MAESLRDQLLKSGIAKQVPKAERLKDNANRFKDERRGKQPFRSNKSSSQQTSGSGSKAAKPPGARDRGEIDLAKAYAMRAQTEAGERKREEQAAAEAARLRRERKAKIQQLLQGAALNKAEADVARSFQYGEKIRRVYVDAAQLSALNAGELGVVQQGGRYLLVTRAIAEQVRDIEPAQVALLVEPGQTTTELDEDGIPTDLMW